MWRLHKIHFLLLALFGGVAGYLVAVYGPECNRLWGGVNAVFYNYCLSNFAAAIFGFFFFYGISLVLLLPIAWERYRPWAQWTLIAGLPIELMGWTAAPISTGGYGPSLGSGIIVLFFMVLYFGLSVFILGPIAYFLKSD